MQKKQGRSGYGPGAAFVLAIRKSMLITFLPADGRQSRFGKWPSGVT